MPDLVVASLLSAFVRLPVSFVVYKFVFVNDVLASQAKVLVPSVLELRIAGVVIAKHRCSRKKFCRMSSATPSLDQGKHP